MPSRLRSRLRSTASPLRSRSISSRMPSMVFVWTVLSLMMWFLNSSSPMSLHSRKTRLVGFTRHRFWVKLQTYLLANSLVHKSTFFFFNFPLDSLARLVLLPSSRQPVSCVSQWVPPPCPGLQGLLSSVSPPLPEPVLQPLHLSAPQDRRMRMQTRARHPSSARCPRIQEEVHPWLQAPSSGS